MKRLFAAAVITLLAFSGLEHGAYAASKKEAAEKKQPSKPAEAAQDQGALSGKVIETMNSAGYTYIYIEKNGQKTWVAVPETKVTKGKTMSFQPGMVMENFESKTLNRKFDKIVFSGGVINAQAGASQPQPQSPGSKAAVVAPAEKIKVDKASGPNAYTVADIYAKSKSLNKKNVSVKGKVVKFSGGIMGKNWIHIQDGTGDAKKVTNNLVVTSPETAAVGDVITVMGTLAVDKDFGGGYTYKVIVEDAKVIR